VVFRGALKSDEGIAIQSTYKSLKDCIQDNENIYIGKIRYIDYATEGIYAGNLYEPLLHKRKSFEHENEIRAVVIKDIHSEESEQIKGGISVSVDLKEMIRSIYVAPTSPSWFSDLG